MWVAPEQMELLGSYQDMAFGLRLTALRHWGRKQLKCAQNMNIAGNIAVSWWATPTAASGAVIGRGGPGMFRQAASLLRRSVTAFVAMPVAAVTRSLGRGSQQCLPPWCGLSPHLEHDESHPNTDCAHSAAWQPTHHSRHCLLPQREWHGITASRLSRAQNAPGGCCSGGPGSRQHTPPGQGPRG